MSDIIRPTIRAFQSHTIQHSWNMQRFPVLKVHRMVCTSWGVLAWVNNNGDTAVQVHSNLNTCFTARRYLDGDTILIRTYFLVCGRMGKIVHEGTGSSTWMRCIYHWLLGVGEGSSRSTVASDTGDPGSWCSMVWGVGGRKKGGGESGGSCTFISDCWPTCGLGGVLGFGEGPSWSTQESDMGDTGIWCSMVWGVWGGCWSKEPLCADGVRGGVEGAVFERWICGEEVMEDMVLGGEKVGNTNWYLYGIEMLEEKKGSRGGLRQFI